jgi:hypothetical protein
LELTKLQQKKEKEDLTFIFFIHISFVPMMLLSIFIRDYLDYWWLKYIGLNTIYDFWCVWCIGFLLWALSISLYVFTSKIIFRLFNETIKSNSKNNITKDFILKIVDINKGTFLFKINSLRDYFSFDSIENSKNYQYFKIIHFFDYHIQFIGSRVYLSKHTDKSKFNYYYYLALPFNNGLFKTESDDHRLLKKIIQSFIFNIILVCISLVTIPENLKFVILFMPSIQLIVLITFLSRTIRKKILFRREFENAFSFRFDSETKTGELEIYVNGEKKEIKMDNIELEKDDFCSINIISPNNFLDDFWKTVFNVKRSRPLITPLNKYGGGFTYTVDKRQLENLGIYGVKYNDDNDYLKLAKDYIEFIKK